MMILEYFHSKTLNIVMIGVASVIVFLFLLILSLLLSISEKDVLWLESIEATVMLLLAFGILMVNSIRKRIFVGLLALIVFASMLYLHYKYYQYIDSDTFYYLLSPRYPIPYILCRIAIWIVWAAGFGYCVRDYCRALDDSSLLGSFFKNPVLFDHRRDWCRKVEEYRSITTVKVSDIRIEGKPVDEFYRKKCQLPADDPFYLKMRKMVRTGHLEDEMRVSALLGGDDGMVSRGHGRSGKEGRARRTYSVHRRSFNGSWNVDYRPGAWREAYDRNREYNHNLDCPYDDPYDCDGDCF